MCHNAADPCVRRCYASSSAFRPLRFPIVLHCIIRLNTKANPAYLHSLEGLESGKSKTSVKFISSVTAREKTTDFGSSYWVENLVSKVRFSDGLETLCRLEHASASAKALPTHAMVEVGPHSALAAPIRQSLATSSLPCFKYSYLPTLVRGRNAAQCVLELTGHLFELGYPVSLTRAFTTKEVRQPPTVVHDLLPYFHDLLPYSWDHSTSYWHESRLSKDYRLREHPYHDLLGLRVVGSTTSEPSWRNILSEDSIPWLRDHVVDNFTISPGSGYLCMAIEAMRQILHDRKITGVIANFLLRNIAFSKALIIPEPPSRIEIQLSLRCPQIQNDRYFTGWEDFRVSSVAPDGSWVEHCSGSIAVDFENSTDEVESSRKKPHVSTIEGKQLDRIIKAPFEKLDSHSFYGECRSNGNMYGSTFAMVKEL